MLVVFPPQPFVSFVPCSSSPAPVDSRTMLDHTPPMGPISRLSHPFHLPVPPLFTVRNLLLPRICCLNLFVLCKFLACPRDFACHLCVPGSYPSSIKQKKNLAERIGEFNQSMDPWERTGAARQGWATPLQQSMLPIQGTLAASCHHAPLVWKCS